MKIKFSLLIMILVLGTIWVRHATRLTVSGMSIMVDSQVRPSPSPSGNLTTVKKARVPIQKRPSKTPKTTTSVTEFCWFPWKAPWRGKCELASRDLAEGPKGPEFCLRSNGSGTFKSRVRMKDVDTYALRFEFSDRTGKLLFRLPAETRPSGEPSYWTKRIDHPGVWYDWNIDFSFPAQHFYKIYYVYGDCLATAL